MPFAESNFENAIIEFIITFIIYGELFIFLARIKFCFNLIKGK
jgi:hypothetical protein